MNALVVMSAVDIALVSLKQLCHADYTIWMGQHAFHLPSSCKQNCIIECYCCKGSTHATEETVDTTLSYCLQVCEQLKSDGDTVLWNTRQL